MNDFTKEELKLLSQALNVAIFEGSVFYRPQYQEIKNKIKSMIDYYCEHLWRDSAINAIYCEVCQKHVEYDE